jgi:hypothetical protein
MGNKNPKGPTNFSTKEFSKPWILLNSLQETLSETHSIPSNVIQQIFNVYTAISIHSLPLINYNNNNNNNNNQLKLMLQNNNNRILKIFNDDILYHINLPVDPSNWMKDIYQYYSLTKLSEIVIPGTHNSATWKGMGHTTNSLYFNKSMNHIEYNEGIELNDITI